MMIDTQLGKLTVEELAVQEVQASSAIMHVTVKGSSYFASDVAMKKAKEVESLLEGLTALGIPEKEIRLKNVVAEAESGILSKSSSAKYNLSIKCRDMDKLSDALAVITGAKNVQLHQLDWQFREDRKSKLDLIRKAFQAAKETAESIAAAVGADITAVTECSYAGFIEKEMEQWKIPADYARASFGMCNTSRSNYETSPTPPVPNLPSHQWRKEGISAKVTFLIHLNNGSADEAAA